MILNSGLDNACQTTAGDSFSSASSAPRFAEWLQYAAFGTGSTEPSASDVTLDAQVGTRTNNRGGFDNLENGGLNAEENLMWYEVTFTRVFSISANVNAAEWGLGPAATGDLSVRDLFRADPNDPQSAPIVLTLEDGDQLQLVVTVRVQADWEYAPKAFVIAGAAGNDSNGTHEGNAGMSTGATTTLNVIALTLRSAWPGNLSGIRVFLTDQSAIAINQNLAGSPVNATALLAGYSPGDYYRDVIGTFSTSDANGDHYAYLLWDTSNLATAGLRFILTDPPFLTKASTHRLTLTVRKHISRL